MSKKLESNQLVQSVDRALAILETVASAKDSLGLSEIGNIVGLHKSTIYRLINTLEHRGYITKDAKANKYKIGIKLFELGNLAINKLEIRKEVHPLLEELMDKTKETVHLGVLDDNQIIYIDKVQSMQTIMYSKIGLRAPVHCTGLGKAILAFCPEEIIEKIIKESKLKRYTENTITDPEIFKQHLEKIRNQGYAIDNMEHEENIRCISAPIFSNKGEVIAAFSITGPTIRFTEEKIQSLINLVKDYSIKMSRLMGYTGSN